VKQGNITFPLGEKEFGRAQKYHSPGHAKATYNFFNLKIHPFAAPVKKRSTKALLNQQYAQHE
jgi:hypothetical protein